MPHSRCAAQRIAPAGAARFSRSRAAGAGAFTAPVGITLHFGLCSQHTTVAEILKEGNIAQKLYLRVRPNGDVDIDEETSWCCSPDEYYKRIPHTLSLELAKSTRDYSNLSADEIEECAYYAQEAASEIVQVWADDIRDWVEAGNLCSGPNVRTAPLLATGRAGRYEGTK